MYPNNPAFIFMNTGLFLYVNIHYCHNSKQFN